MLLSNTMCFFLNSLSLKTQLSKYVKSTWVWHYTPVELRNLSTSENPEDKLIHHSPAHYSRLHLHPSVDALVLEVVQTCKSHMKVFALFNKLDGAALWSHPLWFLHGPGSSAAHPQLAAVQFLLNVLTPRRERFNDNYRLNPEYFTNNNCALSYVIAAGEKGLTYSPCCDLVQTCFLDSVSTDSGRFAHTARQLLYTE